MSICAECETENSSSYKFCKKCGMQLSTDSEQELPDLKEPEVGGHEAEHRQLTVMFCDLVGSTALSESLDPELFREVIIEYGSAPHVRFREY